MASVKNKNLVVKSDAQRTLFPWFRRYKNVIAVAESYYSKALVSLPKSCMYFNSKNFQSKHLNQFVQMCRISICFEQKTQWRKLCYFKFSSTVPIMGKILIYVKTFGYVEFGKLWPYYFVTFKQFIIGIHDTFRGNSYIQNISAGFTCPISCCD